MARADRRRRVRREDTSTTGDSYTGNSEAPLPGDTPRYGAQANIENHPQVTDFVPRRFRVVALLAVGVAAIGVSAELLSHFAAPLAARIDSVSAADIRTQLAERTVAWTSAILLAATALFARLTLSLRRHRVDDDRGRYRVWRTASIAAMLLSANAVVGAHSFAASALRNVSGWQLLPGGVGWWLVPLAVVGGALVVRLAIDVAECRGALTAVVLAVLFASAACAVRLGWEPALLAEMPGLLSRCLPLASHAALLTATLLYARYVVLDVQGLIDHAPAVAKATPQEPKSEPGAKQQVADDDTVEWTDSADDDFEDDDQSHRRLSKAERKRLRKQKQRGRAA